MNSKNRSTLSFNEENWLSFMDVDEEVGALEQLFAATEFSMLAALHPRVLDGRNHRG